jgi:hypothetical protein
MPGKKEPNYQPTSSGAIADVNFSMRVQEANEKARKEQEKFIEEQLNDNRGRMGRE